MPKTKTAVLVALFLALPSLLRAAPAGFSEAELRAARETPAIYTVARTYLAVSETAAPPRASSPAAALPPAGPVAIDRIVNTAQKAWPVVEKNYPVSDARVNYANAVPYGLQDWTQLAGWREPKAYLLTYTAENPYGMKTVTLSYKLVYTWGGSFNGKGLYLNAVSVELQKVDVAFGYHLLAEAAVPDATVVNSGTHAVPVAALQFKMSYTITTAVSAWGGSTIFYIDGTGAATELAGPPAEGRLADGEAGRQLLDLEAKIRREE